MTRARFGWFACILIFGGLLRANSQSAEPKSTQDWAAYGGDQAKTHYSPLTQINKSNVKQLEVAWSYDTQETGGLQTSPIEVAGVLFGISPSQKVFAVDAATGKVKWKFDSGIVGTQPDRGLSYWATPDNKDRRIIVGVMNFVYELDAETGQPIASFGDKGRIDLREGLGRDVATGFIALTSPAVIYKDVLIVGGRLPETLPALPGDIRAYDVRTGKQRWIFHTIPHPGEFGYDTWPKDGWKTAGGANSWGGLTLDAERGMVFAGTGSASYDHFGGNRIGQNLFANCVLALKADTGERVWHYQVVHHDLWDYDIPAPPNLVTVTHDCRPVDAVAQVGKIGHLF